MDRTQVGVSARRDVPAPLAGSRPSDDVERMCPETAALSDQTQRDPSKLQSPHDYHQLLAKQRLPLPRLQAKLGACRSRIWCDPAAGTTPRRSIGRSANMNVVSDSYFSADLLDRGRLCRSEKLCVKGVEDVEPIARPHTTKTRISALRFCEEPCA